MAAAQRDMETSHLNWQKMSAYSAEMLEACRTVTLKVKMLPSFRCSSPASNGPSRAVFSGLSRRRSSGVTVGGGEPLENTPDSVHPGPGNARHTTHQYKHCFPWHHAEALALRDVGLDDLVSGKTFVCFRLGAQLPLAPLPHELNHPFTCTRVVVDFICRGADVSYLSLAFNNPQLLLRGPRPRHPHRGTSLRLELQGTKEKCESREAAVLLMAGNSLFVCCLAGCSHTVWQTPTRALRGCSFHLLYHSNQFYVSKT